MQIDKYLIMCDKIADLVLRGNVSIYEAESLRFRWQCYHSEYDPETVELFYLHGILYLIPIKDNGPIRLIFA